MTGLVQAEIQWKLHFYGIKNERKIGRRENLEKIALLNEF